MQGRYTAVKWLVLGGTIVFIYGLGIIIYNDLVDALADDEILIFQILLLAGIIAATAGLLKMARDKQLTELKNQNARM